ncbi:hypothetical protein PLESTB_001353700 [Pleodorina starrii]|uniref:Uncharacterized protein n=1 Tax=Pleodorina starrii TaxID=330485 RepID=A0A9W6BTW9_9CHLO|nr:hypothetical protein PLESTM_001913500 [Pleodorina starrii]GLC58391.1 hypothetical protein PLESTB_001353700 [Pleodorina starrii]GLC76454.1 hypothetical protein PLESTF_001783100 [Pleodorina starrii]
MQRSFFSSTRTPNTHGLCAQRAPHVLSRACPTSISASRLLLEEHFAGGVAPAVYGDVATLPEPQWRDNQLRWSRPPGTPQVSAPPGSPPIVILPGFGNASIDYTEPFGSKEAAIATRLAVRGWQPFVVPVERKDWFGVARGLLTRGFWRGSLTTHPGYTWYLERVAATVEQAMRETGADQVVLVGHSAGGWLGRAYLADPRYQPRAPLDSSMVAVGGAAAPQQPPPPGTTGTSPNPRVRAMVTLGTPQRPPPPEKKRDMTGGAQGWVDRSYPGAFFAAAGVAYVSVCGRTVRGHREVPRTRKGPRVPEEYAYDSYTEVCGEGQGVAGDCVVPLGSAMLPGARQVVLDGVFHSMSKIGTFEEESGVVWYGSEDVLDCWLGPLVEELQHQRRMPRQGAECLVADGAAAAAAGEAELA